LLISTSKISTRARKVLISTRREHSKNDETHKLIVKKIEGFKYNLIALIEKPKKLQNVLILKLP